ncbi:Uncharacterised protein [Helicobacter acinonychis]|nr:Uncharacterised protein [Helicobacter acinonychis]
MSIPKAPDDFKAFINKFILNLEKEILPHRA